MFADTYQSTNAHCILQDTRSFLDSIEKSNKWVHEDGTHYLSANKDVTTGYFPSMNDTTVKEHAGLLSEPHQLSTSPILRSHARPATRVFVLSAFDERSVLPSTSALTQFISRVVVENEDDFLHDLAHTLGERRTRFSFTVAVHSRSKLDLAASLRDAMLSVTPKPKNVALALVFTGQGAQWFAMGRELFARFPVFAQSIAAAATQLKALGADWDLKGESPSFGCRSTQGQFTYLYWGYCLFGVVLQIFYKRDDRVENISSANLHLLRTIC